MKHFLLFLLLFGASALLKANPIMFENFENLPPGTSNLIGVIFQSTGGVNVELVDNPSKSGINTSDKVARAQVYMGAPTSGIIRLCFSGGCTPELGYPACPSCTLGRYDRLRFKYYKGGLSERAVDFEPWGSPPGGVRSFQTVTGNFEWEYVTFELVASSYSNIQFKLSRKVDNTGPAPASDGDYIYIDDIEFYDSNVGPISSVSQVKDNAAFNCVNLGNNTFSFETTLEKQSNVRIDLISMDGRTHEIYNSISDGRLEIPFIVNGRGLYFVRMSIGNESPVVKKIISQ